MHAAPAPIGDTATGTAAYGQPAIQCATFTDHAAGMAAARNTKAPTGGSSAQSASPASPATRAAETSGPATTFAAGDTSDAMPNTGAVIGTVAAVAVTVSATDDASQRTLPAVAASSHASDSRAKRTSPATAATESRNPRSNALVGEDTSRAAVATASAEAPPALRPDVHAHATATDMTHARTADGCTPDNTT